MNFIPKKIVVYILLVFGSFFVGVIATIKNSFLEEKYLELKYYVRKTLDFEKSWSQLPSSYQAKNKQVKPCPSTEDAIVLISGGQSNAANSISSKYKPSRSVSVWFDGKCYGASDPLLGANGKNGSIWSLLAEKISKKEKKPVLLINGGVGGTQFSDWNDDRSGYYQALLKRVESAKENGFIPDLILWHQGETDALVEKNRDVVEKDITDFLDRLTSSISQTPVYLFQASKCIGHFRENGVAEFIEAVNKAANKFDDVHIGFNTDTLGNDFRWDTCHFNSRGRRAIVQAVLPGTIDLINNGNTYRNTSISQN